MNICFFSGDITRSGGTERVALILANALAEKDTENTIHILSLEEENNALFFEADLRIQFAKILDEPSVNGHKAKYPKNIRTIRNYVREQAIDVFIDIDTILSLYSVPALLNTRVKHIAWEHFSYHQNLGTKLRNWGRKLAAKHADALVVLTERDRQNFVHHFGQNVPVYHIYNPIVSEGAPLGNHYDLESKVILSAGRLAYQKGFDLLIDAAAGVYKKHRDWKWIVLGEGEDRKKLEAKIEALGLKDFVELKGNVNNIEDYYTKSAMFVLTSRFEPFGLVLTESKSFHLPCISFNVEAGPSEIILDHENGYLIEPFDTDEMARAINYLIEHPNVRQQQSALALKDTEKFALEDVVMKWERLFQWLLKQELVQEERI